ncbi:hypothetical protein C8R44DRAFT_424051 [Mycena epipterygia]|nr:hypothetical protein C8R44DRAFT_424051 [Mycena epipterygia]
MDRHCTSPSPPPPTHVERISSKLLEKTRIIESSIVFEYILGGFRSNLQSVVYFRTSMSKYPPAFTPRSAEPAPEDSQPVPEPPPLPNPPNRLFYGWVLDPDLFGPGDIHFCFSDGMDVTFPQPTTRNACTTTFETIAAALQIKISVQFMPEDFPPVAFLAVADHKNGIRSRLNYDRAIPPEAKLKQFADTLHLLKEPQWFDDSQWLTPEYMNKIITRLNDYPAPPIFAQPSKRVP